MRKQHIYNVDTCPSESLLEEVLRQSLTSFTCIIKLLKKGGSWLKFLIVIFYWTNISSTMVNIYFWSNIFEDHKSLAFARYKTQPLPKSIDSVEQKLEAIKLPSFLLKTSSLGTFSRLWAKEGFEIWRNCKIQNIQNGLYGLPQRGQGINLNILRSNLFSNWHSKKSKKTFVCKRLVWWDWVTMQIQ